MFMVFNEGHLYTVAVTGAKVKEKTFSTRSAANQYMYKMADKLNLGNVKKVYDDKHDKTYIYPNNVRFYINRAD